MATLKYPKVRRASRWFDVRQRKLGMWAYALNRIAGILIHGLNGLRVTLTGLDVGVHQHKALFGVLMLVAVVALGAAALKIFGG